ncbi:MAG: ABC transporter substrate-binding protein [Candidatus Limnocylindrales bacterium]
MTRRSRRSPLFALLAIAALLFTACGGGATATPTGAPSTNPSQSASAFTPESYPTTAVDCKNLPKGYTGEVSQIKALDQYTVEFDLCQPDVAFLSKIAFSAFAINDSAYLAAHIPDGSIVQQPNGTGPYKLKQWQHGTEVDLEANTDYWGTKALTPTLVINWSKEAAARLQNLQSGSSGVDGIDNVGPDDFGKVSSDSSLKLYPREGLNVMYVGFNVDYKPFDNEKVRQAIAMGIDRDRIVKNFYPAGSTVASHFTPCSIPYGCDGDPWYTFDATAAKKLLADAGYPDPSKLTNPDGSHIKIHYRDVVRGYLPNATQVVTDIQAQLKDNLGITADIDVQDSGPYIDANNAGKLDGIHILGWGVDYPDITDFLDFHFGGGSPPQFGKHFDDIVAALKTGNTEVDATQRHTAYTTANNLIKQHVPMIPIANGGSAMAYKADVTGAHSSPLTSENFSVMQPADRQILTIQQNAEPLGLYCPDEDDGETLRVCEQINESLYGFKVGGTDVQPSLATECKPNTELSVWTCTLRQGVKFHDGSTLDANDVVDSFAVVWDAANPLHKGRTSIFTYWGGLFGGFLHPEAIPTPAPTPKPSPSSSPS